MIEAILAYGLIAALNLNLFFRSIVASCYFDSFYIVCSSLVLGNDAGLAVVDILQKTCLLSIGTPDIYGKNRF